MSLTEEQRDELIRSYAAGPGRLRAMLAKIPADALKWRPAAGKWSAHEVVVHCADSETNAHMRIRYLVAEKQPVIHGYDQDVWAVVFDYHAHPLDAALATIDAVHANTVPMLRHLPESAWAKAGTHTESGRYTAEDWLRSYGRHLEVHTRQIERNLAAWQAAAR